MAQAALLMLDAMDAATARSWLKDGHKIFNDTMQRLRLMAGFVKAAVSPRASAKSNRKKLAAQLTAMGSAGR